MDEQSESGRRSAAPSPPSTMDGYIEDMLCQLAQLAVMQGRERLAERIMAVAEEVASEPA